MKYGIKFMYLIESTCKKNQTYNFNSVYLHVLVLFNICNPFTVAPRIEKTEVFKKKVDILQAVVVFQVLSWKNIFLLRRKETVFFLYFHHEIIFYSAQLFECTFNLKFC